MSTIKRIEQGKPGHYRHAGRCAFIRNTALIDGDKAIIVSSVGEQIDHECDWYTQVGSGYYYETVLFEAKQCDCGCGFWERDSGRELTTQRQYERVVETEPGLGMKEAQANHEAAVDMVLTIGVVAMLEFDAKAMEESCN